MDGFLHLSEGRMPGGRQEISLESEGTEPDFLGLLPCPGKVGKVSKPEIWYFFGGLEAILTARGQVYLKGAQLVAHTAPAFRRRA